MKIGDKVRFLNEVGGGTVCRFLSQGTILVRDEDGFEIPVLQSQVVAVETNNNNFVHHSNERGQGDDVQKHVAQSMPVVSQAVEATDEHTTETPAERVGGNQVNVYMVFVPQNVQELSTTRFDAYFINDSNYNLSVMIARQEKGSWQMLWQMLVEPNTKLLLETCDRNDLKRLSRLSVQITTWKTSTPFTLKPVYDVPLNLDMMRFYKLHEYEETPFFHQQVLVEDIVCDDEAVHQRGEKGARSSSANAAMESIDAPKELIKVDLHIESLLDDTEGLSPVVLLNAQMTEFRTYMDRNIRNKGQRIVFIHGKGQALLREALQRELKRKYPSCQYQDASFREYGFGGTMVTIG